MQWLRSNYTFCKSAKSYYTNKTLFKTVKTDVIQSKKYETAKLAVMVSSS